MTEPKRMVRYYRCECGRELMAQGIGPHQRRYNHNERVDLGMREAPLTNKMKAGAYRRPSTAPAVIPHPTPVVNKVRVVIDERDLPIRVVKNMEVVRRGDRIGIVEWQEHDG